MHKAEETFSSKPEVRQLEKAVKPEQMSFSHEGASDKFASATEKSDDPLEANNLMLYVMEVESRGSST